ncbi:MAG TPA: hypothetical protein VLS49_14300, partial [Usitatibacter sp.]|nr:hypothetical protein [Usitatibacter sp.]
MIRNSTNKSVHALFAMLLAVGTMLMLAGCGSGGGSSTSASKSSMVVGKVVAAKSTSVSLAA